MENWKQSFTTAFIAIIAGSILFKFPHPGEGFATIFIATILTKSLKVQLQKKIIPGTTPYNPLKIPAKNVTPAHNI